MTSAALADVREILLCAGYADELTESAYPVWLGQDDGVVRADLAAFGRSEPKDMSTAVVTATVGDVGAAYAIATALAAPYFFVVDGGSTDLWIAGAASPMPWLNDLRPSNVSDFDQWLRPSAAMTAKVGLRQLPLFDVPVNLLAQARSRSAERFGPIVGEALAAAGEMLSAGNDDAAGRHRVHRRAARLVIGALTCLVIRDRGGLGANQSELIDRVSAAHPSTFRWLEDAAVGERALLEQLIDQLGAGIDYTSLDPAILSEVYEQALVEDDERKRLGIYYTPPRLAARLLDQLPVETVPPDGRHVLDPACGSGTLLVAAHDRLRDLQPHQMPDAERHRDLAVHLHGYDSDAFAAEIARLTLLLHAQPAGNGWHVEAVDTLASPLPSIPPKIIVTNPPWRYVADGTRVQDADRFVAWSIHALAEGGLLGMLLPASWMSAQNSHTTRSLLAEQFEIFEIWRLPEGTFATSRQPPVALLARKRDGQGGRGSRVVREISTRNVDAFLDGEASGTTLLFSASGNDLARTVTPPVARVPVVPLAHVADVLSGPQPLAGIADRGQGTPYLNHFRDQLPYGRVDHALLWRVAFPEDFEGAWAASIVGKRKVLASAARSASSPWRFRVAVDTLGIAVRNSVRGIAPHDQSDDDLLYALLIVVGSGFASAHAAGSGADRNIPAAVLKTLPIPEDRESLSVLGALGRRAAELAEHPALLADHLRESEHVVWRTYDVLDEDRDLAIARFAGHVAPDGNVRYPAAPRIVRNGTPTIRRIGAVLEVDVREVALWVNGVTPDEGVRVPFPAQMPGWLARPGATFDVEGVENVGDLAGARYRFQRMSWADMDLDASDPAPLLP